MLRITISKSGQPPTTTSFDKREITIGRTASNDVRIPEPGVSSSHARILYTDGSLTLIDLSSTNGTFVNGTRIQGPHLVQPGDEVYVCSHRLAFEIEGAQHAGPTGGYASVGAAPPVSTPSAPAPVGTPPPPVGAPPAPVASPPPPLGPPPPPVGAPPHAPPPIVAAPPSIPPAPRPDPSLPPPLDAPSAPPSLAVPSPAGLGSQKSPDMPTLPPMLGGPPGEPASSPGPTAAEPPADEPYPSPPMPQAPPQVPPAAPPPVAPPVAEAPPSAPEAPPSIAQAAPQMEPALDPPASATSNEPAPPPSSRSIPKQAPVTPSTSAPSAKGELDSPTSTPERSTPSAPKVVLGSKSPVRTGATMMADQAAADGAASEPDPAPAAWSMPRVGAPADPPPSISRPRPAASSSPATLSPAALAGLQRDAQTREACRQVFAKVRDAWLADPSLDDDALIARLRSGLEDLKAVVGHLEPLSLSARMQTELRGVGPLQGLLRDRQVREILLNGPRQTRVSKGGQTADSPDTTFSSDVALAWVVSRLTGAAFGPEAPLVEATTADGHRVHAVHQSLAVDGPIVSIRRASSIQHRYDLAQLTSSATLSDVVAKLLASAVEQGLRIAVFAGPGARAFPMAAALALAAPSDGRHVIVRPDHEPALLPTDAIVLQSTRSGAMPNLVEAALGLAPSRLLIHGIAGEEAGAALAALGRGFDGVVLTSRASSAQEGLQRLAALSGLCGSTTNAETRALRVAGSLDLIVVLNRFGDGVTRVTQVSSPGVSPSGTAVVTDLISFDPHSRNWTHASALQNFITEFAQRGISLSMT